ncbi:ADP-ribosylglycohydrolase family protein [Paraflavitalea pollutisoli]|uniref:ADP-ribosylglycohydrolase family protein n=1 Tax=Paraflavitalea pollutisoli TaxID=3034143 RepID=UPI0023EAA5FC|nr:ADP-ribosylglycohydrolase family protein [Paraflavitalea sp. H1-2-19X]
MKYILLAAACCTLTMTATAQKRITLSKETLKDKIMGGWAGQTIGVTYGGPYEFQFNGTFIQDYQPLPWDGSVLKTNMLHNAGLYDDLYMDLTFVDVFEKYGLNAPVDSFANAFANAGYFLWHANQAARYNILHGIKAPQSGQWQHNPHAEDIDYQIEADYAGLMSPGMPNTASAISDKIGHIMNYGDGWYGGVYIGALYSLAFLHNDIHFIVTEALKVIPASSTYYQCINDVINWHKQYPNDWHRTWYEIQRKWSNDIACHDGIFSAFNIDAKINSAYVVLGLLYGQGDFGRSLEIATRAGQDADCNPSSVGGILGTILGYKKIPTHWKQGLVDIEDIPFKYTDISLNKAYVIGLGHALKNIQANGGNINGDQVEILVQSPKAVALEQGFPNNQPISRTGFYKTLGEASFEFEGTGFSLAGAAHKKQKDSLEYVFEVAVFIDGQPTETVQLSTDFIKRRLEICWKYQLPKGKHAVKLKVLNPHESYELKTSSYIVFSEKR